MGFPFIAAESSLNGLQQATRLLSFEGLVTIARDGRPQPRLAQSWTESPDGLTWTFQLRSNAFFHDSSRVDAASVKESLARVLASPARDFSPGLLDIVSLETPTPDQLVIRLKTRSAFLLDDLVVPISKRVEKGSAVGTGPYVTQSATPTEVVMTAFPDYYRGKPEIERVVWKSFSTARTAWAAMMRGEIDFLYEVNPDALEFMRGAATVQDFSFLRNFVHGVVFNSRRPIFKDSRIRRALNYAINRTAIIDQAFKGRGIPAYTPTWPQHWAFDASLPTYNYDPATASALLESAGVKMNLQNSPDAPPARFRFKCIFMTNALWERMALMIQRDLAQIGVDVQFEAVTLEEFNARALSGDFDAVLADLIVGNSAGRPYVLWYSSSKQNSSGYQNPVVDRAFDQLRQAADDATTRAAFHDLQAAMFDDPPAVFLAFSETTRAVNRRFRPVTPPGGDVFRTIPEWHLAQRDTARDSN
jgi:peptide/nickel transport system substrate-binding protein